MPPIQKKHKQPIDQLPNLADTSLHGAWLNKRVTNSGDDYSPDGYDMTPTGPPENIKVGANFDGAADYYRRAVADWRIADSAGTITAWIRLSALGTVGTIFSSSDEATNSFQLVFRMIATNNIAVAKISGGASDQINGTTTTFTTGAWYYVVLVSSGSAYSLYVNGAAETLNIASGTNSGDWLADIANRDNITIGVRGRNVAFDRFFPGDIKDARYYSEAKSADWIATEYSKGVPDNTLVLDILDGTEELSRYDMTFTPNGSIAIGKSLELDGATSYYKNSTADWRSSDSSGTIMAWINRAVAGAWHSIFSSSDEASLNYFLEFRVSNINQLEITQRNNDVQDTIRATTTGVLASQWYHVVVVSTGTAYLLYINTLSQALVVGSGANNGDWFADTTQRDNVVSGVLNRSAFHNYFNGEIRDLKIFSEAKSADYITDYYNRTKRFY